MLVPTIRLLHEGYERLQGLGFWVLGQRTLQSFPLGYAQALVHLEDAETQLQQPEERPSTNQIHANRPGAVIFLVV